MSGTLAYRSYGVNALAPTERSPIYVAVKIALLLMFIVVALIATRRAGRTAA